MGNMHKEYPFIALLTAGLVLFTPFSITAYEGDDLEIRSINAQIIESLEEDILSLKGKVVIKTDVMEIWSDEATYDRNNQLINLKGNIKALSRNLQVNAETMKADFFNRTFHLKDSTFSFKEKAYGSAEKITIKADNDIELLNISISSCSNEALSWNLNGGKVNLVDEGKNVIIRNINLELNKVPIFTVPFVRTAVGKEKFSGFLSPSVKQGDDGLDLSVPYFFNLAPNYDLTISPRYIQERGTGISSEIRYLTKSASGNLSFSHFSQDRKFFDESNKEGARWSGKYNHQAYLGDNLLLRIHSEHVSDDLYFEDLDDDILGTQQKDFLSRNLLLRWNSENLKVKGLINKFHNLNPLSSNDYDTQPNLQVDFIRSLKNTKIRLETDYSKFSFDDFFNPLNKEKKLKRISIEPSIYIGRSGPSSRSSIEGGRLRTNHETDNNTLNNSYNWAEITHKIFMDKLTKNTFSTFSPILKVIWIDGQNKNDISIDSKLLNQNFDNLFKRNLYSNNDIFIEESRFVLGLEHNYYNYLSGQKMYLSFGRAFFRDKKRSFLEEEIVDSSYVSEFKTNLANNLSINSSLEIDKKFKKIHKGSFGMTYSKEIRKKIELRSIFKRNPKYLSEQLRTNVGSIINEIELISKWEISNNILVFGKVSKDEARNFTRDLSYGIEYSNCCLKIGLMKRKWTDQNLLFKEYELERIKNLTEGRYPERERDNVYVFFELVELGRFGKKISDVLKPKKFQ